MSNNYQPVKIENKEKIVQMLLANKDRYDLRAVHNPYYYGQM